MVGELSPDGNFIWNGTDWEPIPSTEQVIPEEQIRIERTDIQILGPLPNMATDGVNIRAERIEAVHIQGMCQKRS